MTPNKRRVTVKLKHPNPLFEKWLLEWLEKNSENNHRKRCVENALKSLRKYPLPLNSGKECMILKGFGNGLCRLLDEKLKKYKGETNAGQQIVGDPTPSSSQDLESTELGNVKEPVKCKTVKNSKPKYLSQKSKNSQETNVSDTIILQPDTFDVILLIDTAETSGVKAAHEDPVISDLLSMGVNFEIRHLTLGDYLWICRERRTNAELVLPYIVERKRIDDFAHSIKDGRYHEQKFRLSQCGIQNVLYLIESYGKNEHVGLPMSTLMQAAVNTLIADEFQVKFCDNSKSSAVYLKCATNIIESTYKSKMIMSCPRENIERCSIEEDLIPAMSYAEFSKVGSKHKSFSAREMFVRNLLQLKGLSVDKALAITEIYPSVRSLCVAYNRNGENAETLLADITFGNNNRKIGPIISKTIYQLYSLKRFN